MGGLEKLFIRITPILLLICFICFGITHTFQTAGHPNITYLTTETINVGTQDNPNNITVYNFDAESYIQNIDSNILKRATRNVVDTETYNDNLTSFNKLWKNGYQFGDGINTIINGLILVVNSIIQIINIFVIPFRIIAGIMLVGLSIVGINISRDTMIITSLNTLLDTTAIPLIKPVGNVEQLNWLNGTTWEFNIQYTFTADARKQDLNFISNGIQFNAIKYNYDSNSNVSSMWYYYRDENDTEQHIEVYRGYYDENLDFRTTWANNNYKTINITTANNLTNTESRKIDNMLRQWANPNPYFSPPY